MDYLNLDERQTQNCKKKINLLLIVLARGFTYSFLFDNYNPNDLEYIYITVGSILIFQIFIPFLFYRFSDKALLGLGILTIITQILYIICLQLSITFASILQLLLFSLIEYALQLCQFSMMERLNSDIEQTEQPQNETGKIISYSAIFYILQGIANIFNYFSQSYKFDDSAIIVTLSMSIACIMLYIIFKYNWGLNDLDYSSIENIQEYQKNIFYQCNKIWNGWYGPFVVVMFLYKFIEISQNNLLDVQLKHFYPEEYDSIYYIIEGIQFFTIAVLIIFLSRIALNHLSEEVHKNKKKILITIFIGLLFVFISLLLQLVLYFNNSSKSLLYLITICNGLSQGIFLFILPVIFIRRCDGRIELINSIFGFGVIFYFVPEFDQIYEHGFLINFAIASAVSIIFLLLIILRGKYFDNILQEQDIIYISKQEFKRKYRFLKYIQNVPNVSVYTDICNDKEVAVKELLCYIKDKNMHESQEVELKNLKKLRKISGMIRIICYTLMINQSSCILWIIMDKSHQTLMDYVLSVTLFTNDEIYCLIQKMVEIFSKLQTLHFVHRDIKPSNILEMNNQQKDWHISDFGLSRFQKYIYSDNKSSNNIVPSIIKYQGTVEYMSPTRLQSKILYNPQQLQLQQQLASKFKDDVFSLGLTILQVCTKMEMTELGSLNRDQQRLHEQLNSQKFQNYNELNKNIIKTMLLWNEEDRPCFTVLQQNFNNDLFFQNKARIWDRQALI